MPVEFTAGQEKKVQAASSDSRCQFVKLLKLCAQVLILKKVPGARRYWFSSVHILILLLWQRESTNVERSKYIFADSVRVVQPFIEPSSQDNANFQCNEIITSVSQNIFPSWCLSYSRVSYTGRNADKFLPILTKPLFTGFVCTHLQGSFWRKSTTSSQSAALRCSCYTWILWNKITWQTI